jgi:hypothetical protein
MTHRRENNARLMAGTAATGYSGTMSFITLKLIADVLIKTTCQRGSYDACGMSVRVRGRLRLHV